MGADGSGWPAWLSTQRGRGGAGLQGCGRPYPVPLRAAPCMVLLPGSGRWLGCHVAAASAPLAEAPPPFFLCSSSAGQRTGVPQCSEAAGCLCAGCRLETREMHQRVHVQPLLGFWGVSFGGLCPAASGRGVGAHGFSGTAVCQRTRVPPIPPPPHVQCCDWVEKVPLSISSTGTLADGWFSSVGPKKAMECCLPPPPYIHPHLCSGVVPRCPLSNDDVERHPPPHPFDLGRGRAFCLSFLWRAVLFCSILPLRPFLSYKCLSTGCNTPPSPPCLTSPQGAHHLHTGKHNILPPSDAHPQTSPHVHMHICTHTWLFLQVFLQLSGTGWDAMVVEGQLQNKMVLAGGGQGVGRGTLLSLGFSRGRGAPCNRGAAALQGVRWRHLAFRRRSRCRVAPPSRGGFRPIFRSVTNPQAHQCPGPQETSVQNKMVLPLPSVALA